MSNEFEEEEEDDGFGSLKPVGLFRDRSFEQIPCYRNSFMYALLGSFGASLGHFMITSSAKNIPRTAIFSFSGILLPYYFICRHNDVQSRFRFRLIRKELEEYIMKQGTEINPEEIRKAAIKSGLPPEEFIKEHEARKRMMANRVVSEEEKK